MEIETFRAASGVDDWRVLGTGLHARYRCAGLAEAAAFATEIADAGGLGPVPQLDLRGGSITIRLPAHDDHFIDDDDLPAAQWIQSHARARGLTPEPSTLRSVQLAVAQGAGVDVKPFWRAVMGFDERGDEDISDPEDRLPPVWFHEITGGAGGRGRSHVDIYVPAEEAQRIVDAAVAAGGRIADDSHAPDWWTLASPDNHGVDIAPWPDRG